MNPRIFSLIHNSRKKDRKGMSLVETVIGTAVFLMIALAVYQSYGLIFKIIGATRMKTAAFELAQERVETIRNMPYADVGLIAGIPVGTINRTESFSRAGYTFQATTTIRNVDDPFDGTLAGTPNDLSPADFKLVELSIGCLNACPGFTPIEVTTTISPRSLETTTGNGAIFIQVIDANGQPVADADVSIIGQSPSTVLINEVTNASGVFQLVDVPPGNFMYKITASKAGYSSETTHTSDGANPNPVLPHATVVAGTVTSITMAIDRVSVLNVRTVNETCAAVPSVPFTLTGQKKIGTGPDIFKYTTSATTNGSGEYIIPNLEWDSYDFTIGGAYVISGTMPFIPFTLSPNTTQDLYVIPKTASPDSLLVRVKDRVTQLPISGASVTLSKVGYSSTLVTNRGFFSQSDWSGGPGEVNFTAGNMFDTSDGNIEYSSSTGEIALRRPFGSYLGSGTLTSSWFDVGTASTTIYSLDWLPASQNPLAGVDSVKFQLESRNDVGTPLSGFVGPDGTAGTYYTTPGTVVSSDHTNKRYIRYKAYLTTADSSVSPLVSDVSLTFGTNCTPFGQVYYSGLSPATYTIDVTATGYQNYNNTVVVGSGVNTIDIEMDI